MTSLNWLFKVSLRYFFNVIEMLILVRILLSWISPGYYSNPISRFVYNVTEPILAPFRRLIQRSPFGGGIIDFSPVLAILALRLIIQPVLYYIVDLITGF